LARVVTFKKNFRPLKNEVKAWREFMEGGGTAKAARHLQERAFTAMKIVFLKYKRGENRLRRDRGGKIEDTIFGGPAENLSVKPNFPPAVISQSSTSCEFSLIANFEYLYNGSNSPIPHLKWQEEGTKAMTHRQAYRFVGGKYVNIRKNEVRDDLGRFKKRSGQIVWLTVPHPALRPREFILAASRLIKTQGSKITSDFIRQELKKYRGDK
jgi:hypothetical protein